MDDNTKTEPDSGERGRLRLTWPTFRGSSIGWGIITVAFAVNVASCIWSLAEGGVRPLGVLMTAFFVITTVVSLIGTISTARHPRPGPRY